MTETIVTFVCDCGIRCNFVLHGGETELRCNACGKWHPVEKAKEYRKEVTPQIPGN